MLNGLISLTLTFIIFFTPFAFGTVHLWSVTILQCLILLVSYLYIIKSINRGAIEYRENPLNFFFLAFSLYIGFQAWFSITKCPYRTFADLKMSLLYFALFLVVLNNVRTRREVNNIIFKITLAGFFVSLFAIVQFFSGARKIYWAKEVIHPDIIFGPFINENHFAAYISVIALVTLGSVFASIFGGKSSVQHYSLRLSLLSGIEGILNSEVFFVLFAFAVMVAALFLSKSRGGISFFIAGSAFFAISALFRKTTQKIIWLFLVGIFITVLLLSWVGIEKSLEELSTVLDISKFMARVTAFEEARMLFRDYPFFGIGIGSFADIFPSYRRSFGVTFYPHLHNEIFQLIVEAGLAGFIIISLPFLFFLLQFFAACGKTRSNYKYYMCLGILSSFLYLALHTLISFSMRLNAISALFVILLSISLILMHLRQAPGGGSEINMKIRKVLVIKNTKSRPVLYLLSSVVFIYLGFVISKPFIAYTMTQNATTAASFEKAVNLDPKNAELYYDYHEFILLQSDLGLLGKDTAYEKAKETIDKAILLNPYKSAYVVAKGQLELRRRNFEAASSLLREASLMEPSNHRLHLIYAYALFQEGLNEDVKEKKDALLKKGLTHYKTAAALCPYVNFYSTIDDKESFRKLAEALRKEGISVR